ncbi:RNA polymerase sigma-70 factor, ECF subfamily [Chitinophaga sp. YR573]|uniref:sigma-70 family RNA polymerase sigma factor n=1 Tax=Chitinophaga sp. YR573 TaxID=1881040 RepID=UPI0008C28111|nr:sigma-70 family RNA polymerase sigma factor [Chitinophaga sp. YR573]SEW21168.1 RNA polymerase sigma-70 factor, ECF subfamily [Chitinophaga sp. YR573]
MNDAYWLECLKSDPEDIAALKAIFDKYYDVLVFHSTQIVKSKEQAEDIVQEVFIDFTEKRQFENITKSLYSYLTTICTNASLDYLRRNNRLKRNEEEYFQTTQDLQHDNSVLNDIIVREDDQVRRQLTAAFEKIPDARRKIFVKYHIDGLTISNLSALTGLSINTIKTHLRYVKNDLKQLRNEIDPRKLIFRK